MSDYQKQTWRFVSMGLDLRDSLDKLDEGSWLVLNNVKSTQEGQLQLREGFNSTIVSGLGAQPNSIRRIDSSTLIIGAGTNLYRNGNAFATGGYSGSPLSLVAYRPDVSSNSWMYVADTAQMRKVNSAGLDYKWGVTAPTNALTYATAGAGNLNSSAPGATVYDWRATYRSSATGAESNPSPVGVGLAAANQQVSISVVASADPQVDEILLYRRGGTLGAGTGTSFWTLSFTAPNVSGNVIDNNADSTIAANEILSLDRDVPFTSIDSSGNTALEVPLSRVWGPFNGQFLMACNAPNQPGYVFWTNAGSADEAATENNVEVTSPQEPLQNGLIYASLPFVASKDDWYALDFGVSGSSFQPRKTPVGKGLATPWAFCIGPMVWFLSGDGIYETNFSGPAKSITEIHLRPLFRGVAGGGQNLTLYPVDYDQPTKIRMEYFANEVWFSYQDTQGNQRTLIYNTLYERWRSLTTNTGSLSPFYADENRSSDRLLVGVDTGYVQALTYNTSSDNGSTYFLRAQTGYTDQGAPQSYKEYGNIIIDAKLGASNPVTQRTVNVYSNAGSTISADSLPQGTLVSIFTTPSSGTRQKYTRSLGDLRAYNLSVELISNTSGADDVFYQMDVLYRMEEEPLRHWQMITTHGMTGWQHVRDIYISLISSSVVTLTVNVDGTDYVYQIPSTGGVRKKQYIQLQPTKGKIFTYSLDLLNPTAGANQAIESFRLFGSECEVRAKSWNTSLGYQLISPFQDEVEA